MDGFAAFMASIQKAENAEDPDPDFDPAGHLPSGQPILACLQCACLVPDTEECRAIHLNYHREIDRLRVAAGM
jgi:hypothetical protein